MTEVNKYDILYLLDRIMESELTKTTEPPNLFYQSRTKRQLLAMAVFFTLYILTAFISHSLFYQDQGFPILSAPASVALAGVVLFGYQIWPAIALASLMSGVLFASPPVLVLIVTIGNLLQVFFGAYILRRLHFNSTMIRLRDILALAGVAIFTTAIGPATSIIAHSFLGITLQQSIGFIWLGGIMSTLIITPLIIRWIAYPQLKRIKRNLLESLIVFVLLIASDFLLSWTPQTTFFGFEIAFVPLAILLWIALRSGMARMTLGLFLNSVILLTGPFWGLERLSGALLSARMINIELYLIAFAIPFLIIAAISEERDSALRSAKSNVKDLEVALNRISGEDKKKNDFIAVLSHELRNPLAPIVNYLEIMKIEGVGDSKYKDAVEGIDHQVKNIKRLLEDLLDISRITKGKFELKKENVNVPALLKRAVAAANIFVDERKHELILDVPTSPVYVCADAVRIEQALVNLIGNAAKYTGPGGKIWVSCRTENEYVVISVRDTGVGISKEALPHVFTMFNQEDNSITRTHGGLGIGLAIVKLLVEMHDGTVQAKSDGMNKGSEFTMRIPQYFSEHEGVSNPDCTTPLSEIKPAGSGQKILIVDDNADMIRTLSKLLTLLGHTVLSAREGLSAIKQAHEHKPDAIMLDLGIPGMSGFDIARVLRKELVAPVKLVAVSGYGQAEDKIKAFNAGFDHHLTKPVSKLDIENVLAL